MSMTFAAFPLRDQLIWPSVQSHLPPSAISAILLFLAFAGVSSLVACVPVSPSGPALPSVSHTGQNHWPAGDSLNGGSRQ